MLEHQCSGTKVEESPQNQQSGVHVPSLGGSAMKYIPGNPIPQQPMFLASILSALQLVSEFIFSILLKYFL